MNVNIEYCGTNSILGTVYAETLKKGLSPSNVTVNIETVMNHTDVHKELVKAQKLFGEHNIDIALGVIKCDLYKEALARDPKTDCLS